MRGVLIAGLSGVLCLSVCSSASAQTDEERKAIEEIERKAEAEKKKALERIRKKAEADKKKAEAEAKKAEAKRKKEEAEAKKKAAREAKQDEERRKKEEAEAKKRGEPPPTTTAPPVAPTVTPPPAAPPPPPAEPLPEAKPVDNAGGARWTAVGFVQQGESTAPGQAVAAGESGALQVPPALGALGMNRGHFMFGLGRARFNPINDGTTDDDTAFNLLDLNLRLGFEFRNLGSLLAPWFDLGPNLMFGSRMETNPVTGSETGRKFNVFSMQWHGRFGMDLAPIDIFSGGPFVGYRFELYSVKLADEDCTTCTSEGGTTHGPMYGLHARLRTRAKPGEPERFYVDGIYGWRKGEYQTTSHIELEAAVRAGPIFLLGWYEKRLGSSGRFEPSDVEDIGEATAASMPIDQRFGLGMAAIF